MHGNLFKQGAEVAGRSARIRAGIERARREGTRSGRPLGRPRLSEEVLSTVRRSVLAGDSLYQTVRKTGVGMGTVTRIRKELRAEGRMPSGQTAF